MLAYDNKLDCLAMLTSSSVTHLNIIFLLEQCARNNILAGGHGAGLTNMLFASKNAKIIEFPLNPHIDRCYGYIAMALGLDYWLVPEINSLYHLNYTMDAIKANIVVNLVKELLQAQRIKIEYIEKPSIAAVS